jgi:hypothetical protein
MTSPVAAKLKAATVAEVTLGPRFACRASSWCLTSAAASRIAPSSTVGASSRAARSLPRGGSRDPSPCQPGANTTVAATNSARRVRMDGTLSATLQGTSSSGGARSLSPSVPIGVRSQSRGGIIGPLDRSSLWSANSLFTRVRSWAFSVAFIGRRTRSRPDPQSRPECRTASAPPRRFPSFRRSMRRSGVRDLYR